MISASSSLAFHDGPILAIETSCDETSASVWIGNLMASNVIASQIELHQKTGGVVPEVAARAHLEAVVPVIQQALSDAGVRMEDLRGIAVTNRPGLIGALSVGVSAAKALAIRLSLPLIGVHHLEAHVLSPLAADENVSMSHLCLLVSGGHTELVHVSGLGRYSIVGQSRDDAAGEAFDKTARLLGFPYPGGRALSEAAQGGQPTIKFPQGLEREETFDFSFSGLKTAVKRYVQDNPSYALADVCASIQHAIVAILTRRTIEAALSLGVTDVTLAGGVAANSRLRESLGLAAKKEGLRLISAPLDLCTDNAGMIGLVGSLRLQAGKRDTTSMDCFARAELEEVEPI